MCASIISEDYSKNDDSLFPLKKLFNIVNVLPSIHLSIRNQNQILKYSFSLKPR